MGTFWLTRCACFDPPEEWSCLANNETFFMLMLMRSFKGAWERLGICCFALFNNILGNPVKFSAWHKYKRKKDYLLTREKGPAKTPC
jgi:hypothetical protein